MLKQSIAETGAIKQIIQAMPFIGLNMNLANECETLEEFRLACENYFVRNLVNLEPPEHWEEIIASMRERMAATANVAEIIAESKEEFRRIFSEKINEIGRRKVKVFYPDTTKGEDDTITEKV